MLESVQPTQDQPSWGGSSSDTLEANRVDEQQHIAREKSHTSREIDPDVEIVDWDGPNDPENPFNWPVRQKWILTSVALFGTFIALINGTSIAVAAEAYNRDLGISDAHFPNSYWPIASWALGGGIFMMVLLPILEDFGVRWGYLISYIVLIIFIVPSAVAQNFATLVVTRFIAGGCVSLLGNTISSIICDIWAGDRGRTVPMELYITVYLFGSTMGPVIGGVIYQFLNWRWIFYIQIIWYCAFIPLFFFTIKETRGSVILKQRAKKIRAATGKKAYTRDELNHIPIWQVVKTSVQRPAYMLFTEWVVFSLTMWSAFAVGLVYLFTQSIEEVFTGLYGWPAYSTGYVQAAVGIGELLGFWVSYANIHFYLRSAKSNPVDPGTPVPEARLYMSPVGGFFGMTGGMFIYAWTSYPHIPWIAPAIGLAMVGFGINIVCSSIAQYLMDSYSKYAGSAIAAVAFGENVFSAFLPLAAQSMYTNLGYQWASSVLAFLSLALACAPIILLLKGPEIRARSPFIQEARYEHDVKGSVEEA
ncbi:hypothetical protein QM012_001015 [Aureobasidium pullulans]|uniref:Major facilitator superfamily (MFS) profile domain-containing protein n=1 Tax=Aureobasidium pullulans TaxID=5580 RepID=A0ABR0TGX5_AURPU